MQKKIIKKKVTNKISFEEKIKEVSKNVKEVLLLLISEKLIIKDKIMLSGDFEANIKQSINDSIKEKYQNINEKFSEIRKTGKDLGVLNYKMMMIPLKIKVFLSTYEKKDLENILRRLQEIESEIATIKIN
jgi:hypothetical protein